MTNTVNIAEDREKDRMNNKKMHSSLDGCIFYSFLFLQKMLYFLYYNLESGGVCNADRVRY